MSDRVREIAERGNLLMSCNSTDASVAFLFDGAEAMGEIVIERSAYGVYVFVNGKCLGLVDLFHLVPGSPNDVRLGCPQMVIYTGNDGEDPAAHIRWLPTEVVVETKHTAQ